MYEKPPFKPPRSISPTFDIEVEREGYWFSKFWLSFQIRILLDNGLFLPIVAWGWEKDDIEFHFKPTILSRCGLERRSRDDGAVDLLVRSEAWVTWLGFAVGFHYNHRWVDPT